VVSASSLAALIAEADQAPDTGIIGSTILYFDQPERVQALGGVKFNSWFASGRPIGWNSTFQAPVDRELVLRNLDYVSGAAMFVTRRFLEEVGLIPEHFFLYFEEISWALASRHRFRLGYAPSSVVYHHEGSSTGVGRGARRASGSAQFLLYRNRFLFARRYLPKRLPFVYLGMVLAILEGLYRGEWQSLRTFFRRDLWTWPSASLKGRADG
jgi:GT2 family glycosyltransferase